MRSTLKDIVLEVVRAVGPLTLAAIVLQFVLVRQATGPFLEFLLSAALVMCGMVLFLLGIEVGIVPAGKTVGAGLIERRSVWLIMAAAFLVGFSTTIAEPDVLILAGQAEGIMGGAISESRLVYVIGIGVAVFVAAGMLRIVVGVPITRLLTAGYLVTLVLCFFAPAEFIPLAFDAGSVTTGALTAPIVIALGIGLSSVLAGRSALRDGFGLLGLASIGPIIAVMIVGMVAR